ncbi:MAG: hypothetical protein P1P80_00385 [ANME-2 cluster archaeon]|nr:hypothetical protein [ANME-2 cluster archaeon]
MKKVTYLMIVCLITAILIPGCLETKEAIPATVNQATLDELGWVRSGDIQKDSMIQDVGGVEIVINTAMVTYHDENLMEDIVRQFDRLLGAYEGSDEQSGEDQFTSQFFTIQLALPAGISIPESVLMGIIDGQIQNMAQQSAIQDFHDVGEETVTLSSGSNVTARSYVGYIETEGGDIVSVKIRGVLASWSGDGTTTIVLGIIPAEDLVLGVPTDMISSGTFTIHIDVEQEYQDILTLIQNVE